MPRDPNWGKSAFQAAGEKYSRDSSPEWVQTFGRICTLLLAVGFITGLAGLIIYVWLPLVVVWFVIWMAYQLTDI